MTDPRVDAALRAAWAYTYPAKEGCSLESYREHNPEVVANMVAAVTAALAAADAAAWRPIETAPKDGTSILTWGSPGSHNVCETRYLSVGPYIHRVDGARFQKEPGWYWSGWDGAVGPIPDPTHWQPLPKPPTQI